MRDSSARRPRLLAGGVALVALALGLALTGCSDEKAAAPKPTPTPIGRLDTAAMQVPRIEFCGLVPSSAVSAALGGKPDSDTTYGNGDELGVRGIGKDVVHETGCTWTSDHGVTARAWLFARPVDEAFAGTVIESGRRKLGCRTVPGPAYGKPSSTQLCRFPDGELRVRHAGLFGQTWLTCELSARDAAIADLRSRSDAWCVEVVNALNAAR